MKRAALIALIVIAVLCWAAYSWLVWKAVMA